MSILLPSFRLCVVIGAILSSSEAFIPSSVSIAGMGPTSLIRQRIHMRAPTPSWEYRPGTATRATSSSIDRPSGHGSSTSPRSRRHDHHRFGSSHRSASTSLQMVINSGNDPDVLLRMVEELTMDEVTPELMIKMERVERALASFLEENAMDMPPRPPSLPPPMGALYGPPSTSSSSSSSPPLQQPIVENLWRAERALEKLRQRLRNEEEALFEAEKALQRSLQEEQEILRQAEEALQRSRAAAEERKEAAMLRTEVAIASAELARENQRVARKQQQQQQQQQNPNSSAYPTRDDQQGRPSTDVESTKNNSNAPANNNAPRPTMVLENLFDRLTSKSSSREDSTLLATSTKANNVIDATNGPAPASAPYGVPVIYDWVQNEVDGSVTGRIKNSPNFKDGATISTSSAAQGAQAWSLISTASGSRYFLEEGSSIVKESRAPQAPQPTLAGTQSSFSATKTYDAARLAEQAQAIAAEIRKRQQEQRQQQQEQQQQSQGILQSIRATQSVQGLKTSAVPGMVPTTTTSKPTGTPIATRTEQAPEGIPGIRGWKIRDGGGIAGLVYGSPNAEDGDYIETSPIANGSLENGNVVETKSGSRYFLSADTAFDGFSALRDFVGGRRGGTITITKREDDEQTKERNQGYARAAMDVLEKSLPRSTFSLMDLFGGGDKGKAKADAPEPPPSPPADRAPPDGVPTLADWSSNDDGTVTGVVYGSRKIDDGNLVTTSPIVSGERKQYEIVTTVSGSIYFLG